MHYLMFLFHFFFFFVALFMNQTLTYMRIFQVKRPPQLPPNKNGVMYVFFKAEELFTENMIMPTQRMATLSESGPC